VPAGFNNIVGLKPTPGTLSNEGVVPACASLDCVSVFALSCADADAVLTVAAGGDLRRPPIPERFRFGVPEPLEFFGDAEYAALFARAIMQLEAMGGMRESFDYVPFSAAAQLLYTGPWVAERTAAVGAFIESADDKAGVWPTTRDIILGGRNYSAVDAFEGQYTLARLKTQAQDRMQGLHFLALPTAGTIYTLADLAREPVLYNSHLGHYTNFVNFFGLGGVSLPFGFRADGLPFGITLIGHADDEQALLAFGARWQRAVPLPLGKTASQLPPASCDPVADDDSVSLAVVGAHMSGLPLNHQLTDRDARLDRAARTAPTYRLYALPGGPPQRPGLVRVSDGGAAIDLEVWRVPRRAFGDFVASIPAPLGIGRIDLDDGSTVQGFICESYAAAGAQDITSFGGWRAYLKTNPK
jgi:allophanate hydrolase